MHQELQDVATALDERLQRKLFSLALVEGTVVSSGIQVKISGIGAKAILLSTAAANLLISDVVCEDPLSNAWSSMAGQPARLPCWFDICSAFPFRARAPWAASWT